MLHCSIFTASGQRNQKGKARSICRTSKLDITNPLFFFLFPKSLANFPKEVKICLIPLSFIILHNSLP